MSALARIQQKVANEPSWSSVLDMAAAALPQPWGPKAALHPVPHPRLCGGDGWRGAPPHPTQPARSYCTLQRGQLPPPRGLASSCLPRQTHICLSFQASLLRPPSGTSNHLGNICCAAQHVCLLHIFCDDIVAYCTSFRLFIFALSYAHKPVYDTPYQLDD